MAARDAHQALLELKKLVDDAAETTHAAEFEAIHLAISSNQESDIRSAFRVIVERLKSPNFGTAVSQVLEKLEVAAT